MLILWTLQNLPSREDPLVLQCPHSLRTQNSLVASWLSRAPTFVLCVPAFLISSPVHPIPSEWQTFLITDKLSCDTLYWFIADYFIPPTPSPDSLFYFLNLSYSLSFTITVIFFKSLCDLNGPLRVYLTSLSALRVILLKLSCSLIRVIVLKHSSDLSILLLGPSTGTTCIIGERPDSKIWHWGLWLLGPHIWLFLHISLCLFPAINQAILRNPQLHAHTKLFHRSIPFNMLFLLLEMFFLPLSFLWKLLQTRLYSSVASHVLPSQGSFS